jgi:ribonuclease P protein component
MDTSSRSGGLGFGRAHRLSGRRAFAAVFDARQKTARGPLVIFRRPNELGHPRLGLSVSGRVGNAVRRHRIKRLLREAFRLLQHDLPACDFVLVVRPHKPLGLPEYQRLLRDAARAGAPTKSRPEA